jgi:hypothetical protein
VAGRRAVASEHEYALLATPRGHYVVAQDLIVVGREIA